MKKHKLARLGKYFHSSTEYSNLLDNWEELREGDLREFSFLHIDVVEHSKLVKDNASIVVDNTLNYFKKYVEERVKSHRGKLWNWLGDGGLCAFYENDKVLNSVICGINLLENLSSFNLYRNTTNTEIRIRIAIHKGIAKYQVDTGSIHSDTINFVAHLESQRTEINSIYVSKEVYTEFPSKKIRRNFEKQGIFEEKEIFRYMSENQREISDLHKQIKDLQIEKKAIISKTTDNVGIKPPFPEKTWIKGIIGVVAPIIKFPTQFYLEIIKGIREEARNETQIILFDINKEQQSEVEKFFGKKEFLNIVDGLINISVDIPSGDLHELSELKFPIVNIHHSIKSPPIVGNIIPEPSGFKELMDHLVEYHSCKDLILITRHIENPMKLMKVDPYREAKRDIFVGTLRKNKILIDDCPTYELEKIEPFSDEISSGIIEIKEYSFDAGREIYTKIRDTMRRNTAIVCLADTVAIGFIQAAFEDGVDYKRAGIRITGFDNSYFSQFHELSTIDYNLPLTGMLAYNRLNKALENLERTGDLLSPVEDPVPMKFVRRRSCCF
jgi:DNA-binding LacI/PurR family transcriptional regulator/class 3 adenylate cyclase